MFCLIQGRLREGERKGERERERENERASKREKRKERTHHCTGKEKKERGYSDSSHINGPLRRITRPK